MKFSHLMVTLAVASLLFGCSASVPMTMPELAPVALHHYEASPVFGSLGLAANDVLAIDIATAVLVQRCMNSRVFAYPIPAMTAYQGLDCVSLTVEDAQLRGYGKASTSSSPPKYSVSQASYSQLAPSNQAAYGIALDGDNADRVDVGPISIPGAGCRFNADAAIIGNIDAVRERTELAGHLAEVVESAKIRAESTSLWKTILKGWSRCVAEAGYGQDLSMDRLYQAESNAPVTEQVQAATVDARCRERLLLDETRASMYAAYEKAGLEQAPELLARYSQVLKDERSRALRVLGSVSQSP